MKEGIGALFSNFLDREREVPSEECTDRLEALSKISDPLLREQQIKWFCFQQKFSYFFALVMLCGLSAITILVIVGSFPAYVQGSGVLTLSWMVRKTWKFLIHSSS
jgi:hypothetical protein